MEQTAKAAKKDGVVFVSGIFNVLHPGHFRFLNFAKAQGARLVAGVLSNRLAPEATVDEAERMENLRALSFIDDVILIDQPVEKHVAKIKPDTVVKGWEHHNLDNPEKTILDSYGGRLVFSSGEIKLSGFGDHGERVKGAALKSIAHADGYLKRHAIMLPDLCALLGKFAKLNICVIGDIIVDNYTKCQPVGMSREDPTIVVRPAGSTYYLGGAGIVAAHAAGLGADVNFISVTGADEAAGFCRDKLAEYNVTAHLFADETRPTTQKKRYRASGKTLLRVNEYSDHPISGEIGKQIMEKLQSLASDIDVIIFSDFSYGMLPQALVDGITRFANKKNIVIAADSQSSSQVGDIARFKNVSLVTPTEHEARLSTHNYADGLVKLAEKVRDQTSAQNVVITLGEEGLLVSTYEYGGNDFENDRLPALQSAAIDPAGAGDALLVTMAMALASGGSIWEAAYLGSLASAVQVSRTGNIPLQHHELNAVLAG